MACAREPQNDPFFDIPSLGFLLVGTFIAPRMKYHIERYYSIKSRTQIFILSEGKCFASTHNHNLKSNVATTTNRFDRPTSSLEQILCTSPNTIWKITKSKSNEQINLLVDNPTSIFGNPNQEANLSSPTNTNLL